MKLAVAGTPRVVVFTLFRVATDAWAIGIETRMMRLALRCGR